MSDFDLAHYPVVTTLRVSWGQMDAFQHLNNVVYIRYFEDARLSYFERLGFEGDVMSIAGVGPILASISCNFRFPITYPDRVLVGARVTRLGQHSFGMEYALISERHQRLAADGDSVIVTYDYGTMQKAPLPTAWRDAIIALESTVDPNALQRF